MGTSNSGGGPADKTPLLPDWAQPGATGGDDGDDAGTASGDDGADEQGNVGDDGNLDGDGGSEDAGAGDEDGNQTDAGGADSATDRADESGATTAQPMSAAAPRAKWAAAKRRLGLAAASGKGGRARIARAGRAYVRARGGARSAARSATSARGATARLGGFLSDVANRGVGPALESLGLSRFSGRDAPEVFAAIVDALAPEGADLEQAATRGAIEQTLAGLFEQYVGPDGSVAALEAMTPDAIRTAVEASVAASIFNRWLGDLERMLEEKAVTATQAVRLERDMESYIRDTVKLDLMDKDPLNVKWDGPEGSSFVERIYGEAYSIIGGRR